MSTNSKRIIHFAMQDFSRNKGISAAAVLVLTITIMLITGLFFFRVMVGYLSSQIQDKIDITAYFIDGTSEEQILSVKDEITKMTKIVRSVEYVSKDQALADFNEMHKADSVLSGALQEVGKNPFLPSLNITTNGDPSQYAEVANVLQTSDFSDIVDSVDFSKKKDIIEKIYSITSKINIFGLVLGIILVLVAVLVVYNTIKLAIDGSKEEINTMKIVGASDWFVRGPFVVQGIIYGVIAFLICIVITAIFAYFLSPQASVILPGFGMWGYFLTKSWIFVLIQLGFGVGVGVISSLIVVKKHLDV